MRVRNKPFRIKIIVPYGSTTESIEDKFHHDLKKALKETEREVTLILGNFNAKVGRKADGGIVGEF